MYRYYLDDNNPIKVYFTLIKSSSERAVTTWLTENNYTWVDFDGDCFNTTILTKKHLITKQFDVLIFLFASYFEIVTLDSNRAIHIALTWGGELP